ncbi:65-kDa microtubule-associated protein 1 [Hibiscus syriacus]|uniref:65-kDa microtubule-associated protein 1 n=1 Tax=Hibiscus syriacus TaxID=106335 RepID=A0A6A2X768_HIBSY|nr:65-kDa microtubule-associated protein 1-like [Hibiscus syriacus]KAE8654209.1 65-kDa microtubule-associated protein 1 [Hibiscus syriacus]
MAITDAENPLLGETTCGSLLQKLQEIWDEVGECDEERDKMLLQIEQECLDVYKRKVEQAAKSRAQLLQALSDANLELSTLVSALGDKSLVGVPEKASGTIKEQLAAIAPTLEQLWKQKEERVKEFSDVQSQIQKICGEIAGNASEQTGALAVDESDLSLSKLDEYQVKLQELQKEKSDRLHKVLEFVSTVHDLCAVLGMDFFSTVTEVHPSLDDTTGVQSKSISNDTLSRLAKTVSALNEDKKQRLHKLQELAAQLIDLWNLMDTPEEERRLFDHVTCNISASVDEVTVPGSLALDLIEQAEIEVERLDQLKASKMKEIAFKKQVELEEIFARAHIEINPGAAREKIMALIDSGNVEPTELLADMDNQIAKAKEEAHSRKEILDRVEKWMSACEEESWLEDYNRDENRYNSSRGAHLNLKRAEKARILVNKIPGMVDTLVAKTRAWEEIPGITFTYDGVPLLAMLDEYAMLRQEREEEKRRFKDQKKFSEQQNPEQEAIFSSRPSPARASGTKVVGPRANVGSNGTPPSRRLSVNASQNESRFGSKDGRRDSTKLASPSNYVTISKEDAASHVSGTDPVPASP